VALMEMSVGARKPGMTTRGTNVGAGSGILFSNGRFLYLMGHADGRVGPDGVAVDERVPAKDGHEHKTGHYTQVGDADHSWMFSGVVPYALAIESHVAPDQLEIVLVHPLPPGGIQRDVYFQMLSQLTNGFALYTAVADNPNLFATVEHVSLSPAMYCVMQFSPPAFVGDKIRMGTCEKRMGRTGRDAYWRIEPWVLRKASNE